jgi:hypothetical protein
MALQTKTSAVWSFTTAGGAAPPPSGSGDIVVYASTAPLEAPSMYDGRQRQSSHQPSCFFSRRFGRILPVNERSALPALRVHGCVTGAPRSTQHQGLPMPPLRARVGRDRD